MYVCCHRFDKLIRVEDLSLSNVIYLRTINNINVAVHSGHACMCSLKNTLVREEPIAVSYTITQNDRLH